VKKNRNKLYNTTLGKLLQPVLIPNEDIQHLSIKYIRLRLSFLQYINPNNIASTFPRSLQQLRLLIAPLRPPESLNFSACCHSAHQALVAVTAKDEDVLWI